MRLGKPGAKNNFNLVSLSLAVSGFGFGIHPEIGSVVLLIVVSAELWYSNGRLGLLERWLKGIPLPIWYALLVFTMLRLFVGGRVGSPWMGALEGLAGLVFVVTGRWVFLKGARQFGTWTLIGLCCAVLITVLPYVNSSLRGASLNWLDSDGRVVISPTDTGWKLRPLDSSNAWLLQQESLQGTGKILYRIELRAAKPFKLNQSVINAGISGGRVDRLCDVGVEWTRCDLEALLPVRSTTLMGIGGYDTWNSSGSVVEVRSSKVIVVEPPQLRDVLGLSLSQGFAPRLQGWSFNANAFAAHIVALSLLGLMLTSSLAYASLPLLLAGVWLSGSRNGLVSWVVLVALSIVARAKRPIVAFLVLVSSVALLGFIVWQLGWTVPHTLRPLNFDDGNGRGVIYRLAIEAFRSAPAFGVGDLRIWMGERIDPRDIPRGVNADDVSTHAHNALLQIVGESGLVGLFSWVVIFTLIGMGIWNRRDLVGLFGLGVLGLLNTFDYFLLFAPVQAVFWWAALGLFHHAHIQDPLVSSEASV